LGLGYRSGGFDDPPVQRKNNKNEEHAKEEQTERACGSHERLFGFSPLEL
jgi:hypothetical protein